MFLFFLIILIFQSSKNFILFAAGGNDPYAECFVQKLKNNGLQWGGEQLSPDPVHVDDGLNKKDNNLWESLYYEIQSLCQ